jgi:hypothetical protein
MPGTSVVAQGLGVVVGGRRMKTQRLHAYSADLELRQPVRDCAAAPVARRWMKAGL